MIPAAATAAQRGEPANPIKVMVYSGLDSSNNVRAHESAEASVGLHVWG